VDEHLKLLAEASLQVSTAEEAVEEGAFANAREALDAAAVVLAELRERWPAMGAAERRIVGAAAGPVRARLDAASARVPRISALSEGTPVDDPEQESEPEAA
jgi:hypothetical protein